MPKLIVIGVVGAIVLMVVGFAYIMISISKKMKRQAELMTAAGFAPCEDKKKELEEKMLFLNNNDTRRGIIYRVEKPMSLGNIFCFWFSTLTPSTNATRAGKTVDDSKVTQEQMTFLFPFIRASDKPVSLILVKKQLSNKALKAFSFFSGLEESSRLLKTLPVSDEHASRGLLAAFGPEESSLDGLLNSDELDLIFEGAQLGISELKANGAIACATMSPGSLKRDVEVNNIAAYLKRAANR